MQTGVTLLKFSGLPQAFESVLTVLGIIQGAQRFGFRQFNRGHFALEHFSDPAPELPCPQNVEPRPVTGQKLRR